MHKNNVNTNDFFKIMQFFIIFAQKIVIPPYLFIYFILLIFKYQPYGSFKIRVHLA